MLIGLRRPSGVRQHGRMLATHARAQSAARLFVALIALCAVVIQAPASAGPYPSAVERSVTRKGSCTGPTNWTLVLSPSSGKLVVTFSARGGAAGQTWSVFMKHNANLIFSGSRTSGAGGKFSARKTTTNLAGTDKFAVSADNNKTNEICSARASI